jgi:hypothetical protein
MGSYWSQKPSVLGPLIVQRQGLIFTLLSFLGPHFVIKFQLVNRRCYDVIVPLLLQEVVLLPLKAQPEFLSWGLGVGESQVAINVSLEIEIRGAKGKYFGEVKNIVGTPPNGRGFFLA